MHLNIRFYAALFSIFLRKNKKLFEIIPTLQTLFPPLALHPFLQRMSLYGVYCWLPERTLLAAA